VPLLDVAVRDKTGPLKFRILAKERLISLDYEKMPGAPYGRGTRARGNRARNRRAPRQPFRYVPQRSQAPNRRAA
jgi:hypothetical protein